MIKVVYYGEMFKLFTYYIVSQRFLDLYINQMCHIDSRLKNIEKLLQSNVNAEDLEEIERELLKNDAKLEEIRNQPLTKPEAT